MKNSHAKAFIFIALTFLVSWVLAFSYFALGGSIASTSFRAMGAAFMSVPMICALLTQKVLYREDILQPLGISIRLNRWTFAACILPIFVVVASTGACFLFVKPFADYSIRSFFFYLLRGLALHALPTAVIAFGEEVGWRGLLQREWSYLGFWKCSSSVGFIWGLWHTPLILHGYNFPGHPVAGVFGMIIWCILFSPLIAYICLRSGSVIAAAIMHGTWNVMSGAPTLIFSGTDYFIALLAVLLVLDCGLFWLDRNPGRPNKSPEPTAVGAGSSAVAVRVASRRWFSFGS